MFVKENKCESWNSFIDSVNKLKNSWDYRCWSLYCAYQFCCAYFFYYYYYFSYGFVLWLLFVLSCRRSWVEKTKYNNNNSIYKCMRSLTVWSIVNVVFFIHFVSNNCWPKYTRKAYKHWLVNERKRKTEPINLFSKRFLWIFFFSITFVQYTNSYI